MSLLQLPNELLLTVVSHLALIRPFDHHEPYIDAFQRYQEENERRLAALAALCRTSKTLRNIATPELYSAVVSYSGGSHARLMGFLRTLIARPELQKNVKYIHVSPNGTAHAESPEQQLRDSSSDRGPWTQVPESTRHFYPVLAKEARRLWESDFEVLKLWQTMAVFNVPQAILAVVFALAFNLEHLAIISTSPDGIPIIPVFRLCETATQRSYSETSVKFARLLNLVLSSQLGQLDQLDQLDQLEDEMFGLDGQYVDPVGICPSLRHIQLSGYARLVKTRPEDNQLSLDSLHLRNSICFGPVIHQMSRCVALVRLNINWPILRTGLPMSDLHEALLIHEDTLKSLTMEIGNSMSIHMRGRWDAKNQLGSFTSFTALRSLRIPSGMLLGNPPPRALPPNDIDGWWVTNSGTHRISDLLPPTLEKLELSETFFLGTSIPVLHDLADDKAQLPGLCSVKLRSRFTRSVRRLEKTFASHGVSFQQVSLRPSIPTDPVRDILA